MNKNQIECSVIVLNYFGEKVIQSTINSLLKLDYPKNKFEIIIVDNTSKDKSRIIIDKIVSKNKDIIKKIYLEKNTGFAKGNNQGIKIANGKYVVLLNNDCLVDKNWLKELYKVAKSDKNIFSVGSKILLYPKYFSINLPVIENFWLHKVLLSKSNILNFTKDKKISIPFIYYPNKYVLEIPFDNDFDHNINLEFIFLNSKKCNMLEIKSIYNKYINIKKIEKINNKYYKFLCELKISQINEAYNKIQNAGSIVFQDGYGRDIGAEIKYQTQNYENDIGQYDTTKEVYSTCGAAVLYNKKLLDKIGYLDESFFMYYEDTEISERARILGYKNIYCHKAIARHLHALSSKEWSPFFLFNVEKGRLLHLYYSFPNNIFIKEFIKFTIKSNLKLLKNIVNGHKITNDFQNLKVIFDITFNIFRYQKIKRSKKLNTNKVYKNYKSIINGYWYQN